MTAQIADRVDFGGAEYDIVGARGGRLFEPGEHQLRPSFISTACWRGYICWYQACGGSLRLARLLVGPDSRLAGRKLRPGDVLLGVPLTGSDVLPGGGMEAAGLDLPVAFTGGLLLGARFISSLYVHMGFHPAWKFRKVIELLLEDGLVTGTADRSAEIAAIRDRIENGEQPDPDGPRGGIGWVKRTFGIGYDRSFPAPRG